MNKERIIKILFSLSIFAISLYSYLVKQNHLTTLKLQIPKCHRELEALKVENIRLQYEIEQFENPSHLMELLASKEFSHLKHPFLKEVLTLPKGIARLDDEQESQKENILPFLRRSF